MHILDSTIDEVTVFRSGAQITRVADLRVEDGVWPGELRIKGLPLSLDDQSLRIRASFPEGGGGVVAADLRVDLDLEIVPALPLPPTQDLQPLRLRQRRLNLELDELTADLQALGHLEAPARPAAAAGTPPLPFLLEPRRALVSLRQEQLQRLSQRRFEVTEELQEIAQQLREAERAAVPPPPPAPEERLRKAVIVGLRRPPEAQPPLVRLHLSYLVAGARWAPSYTLRFDRDLTMAELSMRAAVCQTSGEDWVGAHLAISTADPSTWKELAELPSKRLGRSQSSPVKPGWRPPPLGTEALFADFDRGPSRELHPATAPVAPSDGFEPLPAPPVVANNADPFATNDPFSSSTDPFAADPFGADPFGSAPDPFAADSSPQVFAKSVSFLGSSAPQDKGMVSSTLESLHSEPATRSGMMLRRSVEAPPPARSRKVSPDEKPMLERSAKVMNRPAPSAAPAGPPVWAVGGGAPRRWRDEVAAGGGGGPVEVPPSLAVGREHLAYALLRMPAADESGRGKLQAQTAVGACVRLWKANHPELSFDPARIVEDSLRLARRALQMAPPQSHRFPGSIAGFDYLYPGESPVDLPSEAQFHSLPLLTRQLTTHLQWVAVPRVTTDVFRQAEIESLPDLALPGGPTDVFVGRDYLLTTVLGDTAPGGTVKLGMGVEQGVKVVRNTSFKESTAGMMGGTLQLRHTIDIELANRLARDVRLEVRESIPLPQSGQDEVKVKVESCEPAWEPLPTGQGEPAPGSYRWSVRLSAGEKTSLRAVYLVEMSSKLELVGGNRREE